jgi:hypothetical protein
MRERNRKKEEKKAREKERKKKERMRERKRRERKKKKELEINKRKIKKERKKVLQTIGRTYIYYSVAELRLQVVFPVNASPRTPKMKTLHRYYRFSSFAVCGSDKTV